MTRYEHHSDGDLVKLLGDGDERAFEAIYRRYAADMNRFASGKTGSREEGGEIVQELFVWLWTNREGLDRIHNIKTYLFHALKNRILSYYRASEVRERYANNFARFNAAFDNSVEEHMDVIDLSDAIERSLRDLPEKCRMAFRLSRRDHMPISGIAEEMAISRRAVENYISQALRHIRKHVKTGR